MTYCELSKLNCGAMLKSTCREGWVIHMIWLTIKRKDYERNTDFIPIIFFLCPNGKIFNLEFSH